MSLDLTLWDGGYGPTIQDWRAIRDQVFSELAIDFKPDVIRFADGNTYNFSDRSHRPVDARAGCNVNVSSLRVGRPLCHLLFELAERARLFVLIADQPEFLRPPALRGLDLDRGSVPIADLESAEALFCYFVPKQQVKSE